jgi:HK97 family phage prohead protease
MEKTRKQHPNVERRTIAVPVEFRAAKGDEPAKLVGYAAVFNSKSQDLGGFREQIAPGAFRNSIKDRNIEVKALFNHDPNLVLGSTSGGTLRLAEDETGLRCEIEPPNTTAGRDVMTLVERGDINKMSFGFMTNDDTFEVVDGEVVRTLLDVDVFDVSPVTYPAYQDTAVAVRSLVHFAKERRAAIEGDTVDQVVDRLLALSAEGAPEPADVVAEPASTYSLDLLERELRIREADC